MILGDLISRLSDAGVADETLLRIGDLAMLAAVRERAAASDLSPGAFMAAAVRRYSNEASDEEWMTLLGAMNRDEEPGAAFLRRALALAMASNKEASNGANKEASKEGCGHGAHA